MGGPDSAEPPVEPLLLIGVLSIGSAAAEISYIVIPKKEQIHEAGCCTTTPAASTEDATKPLDPGEKRRAAALYAIPTLVLAAGLLIWPRRERRRRVAAGIRFHMTFLAGAQGRPSRSTSTTTGPGSASPTTTATALTTSIP